MTTTVATSIGTEGPRVEPGKLDERSAESDTMAESGKNGMYPERLQPPDTENGMSGGVGGGRGAILCPRPDFDNAPSGVSKLCGFRQ